MKTRPLVILCLCMLTACGKHATEDRVAAPELRLTDLSGKPTMLSDYKGKIVLLDFWATWCEPCREAVPDLIRLAHEYKNKGVVVVGVSVDENGAADVAPFVKKNGIDYMVWLTEGGRPPAGYPVFGLPSGFLIGRDGIIYQHYVGVSSYEELARDIDALLLVK